MARRLPAPRINLGDIAAGMAAPGNDTREWVSYGVVRGGMTEDDPCVEFENDQPLVRVMLQPSLKEVRARVAMRTAGNGEADWHPFIPGDEVICLLPEGTERAGAVILGKLCNAIDKFPSGSIAGQDPRKNAFAFRRTRTPVIEELNGPVMLRSALTGGFISIDDAGVLTLRGGNPDDPNASKPAPGLQMGPDGISMQDASAKFGISIGPTSGALLILVDDAVLSLSSSAGDKPSQIGVPGVLGLATNGNPPIEHVATTESVANLIANAFTVFATLITPMALLSGSALGPAIIAWLQTPAFAAMFTAASVGPTSVLNPAVLQAILGGFATMLQKPNTPSGQLTPGLGCPGLFAG
jgi:hypothetical protein